MDVCKVTKFNLAIFVVDVHKVAKFIIPGLITMSAFDWSMTGWHKTHATGLKFRDVTLRCKAPARWR
jgi:hypothetical protein